MKKLNEYTLDQIELVCKGMSLSYKNMSGYLITGTRSEFVDKPGQIYIAVGRVYETNIQQIQLTGYADITGNNINNFDEEDVRACEIKLSNYYRHLEFDNNLNETVFSRLGLIGKALNEE